MYAAYVCEASTGKLLQQFPHKPGEVMLRCAVHASGEKLVCVSGVPRPADSGATTVAAVRVWEIMRGKDVRELSIPGEPGARWTNCGDAVILNGGDTVGLWVTRHWKTRPSEYSLDRWDVTTGKQLHHLTLPTQGGDYLARLFSGDGHLFVLRGRWSEGVHVLDGMTGRQLGKIERIENGRLEFMVLSFDGKILAGVLDGRLVLLEFTSGRELRRLPAIIQEGNSVSRVCYFAFSPDSSTLAAAGTDEVIHLWDVATGMEALQISVPGLNWQSSSLAFSPNGKTLAAFATNTLHLWDVATGKPRHPEFGGHDGPIYEVAISPNGKRASTAGSDGTIRLWDASSGEELGRWRHEPCRGHVLFSPDNKLVAVVIGGKSNSTIHICQAATGKELGQWDAGAAFPLGFSEGGRYLILYSLTEPDRLGLALHDVLTGKQLRSYAWHWKPGPRDGRLLLPCPVCSSDGSLVAKPEGNQVVTLMNLHTGRDLHHWDSLDGTAIAFSPDGRTLLARQNVSEGKPPWALWEVASGCKRGEFQLEDPVNSLGAISPDGSVVIGTTMAGELRLSSLTTGQTLKTVAGHRGSIRSLALSADGKRLVTGGEDAAAVVWDLTRLLPRGAGDRGLNAPELGGLWAALAGTDAEQAYRAVNSLTGAPAEAVPFLRERLQPARRLDRKMVDKWIAELDSDQFVVREKATEGLQGLGRQACPALRRVLGSKPSAEVRRRAQDLLEKMEAPRISPDLLRELRAVEILEHIGTEQAQRVLEGLASGEPGSDLTEDARESLRRLRGAAP